ncbi:hypothetical protein Agub_g10766 [Astrephomene gubernaculifera]|uniref:Metallo-beta-lactamase domain-containing protein n=1 Tax=Astrephomene gubernaculifera TaxID=47775 RepID=A0AAD3HPA9_9CHLO|nr:hypothetical protein Agub_g10766 [Astrephomene gubernaculifera]
MVGVGSFVAGVSPQLPAARRKHGRDRLTVSAQSEKSERWRHHGSRGTFGSRLDSNPTQASPPSTSSFPSFPSTPSPSSAPSSTPATPSSAPPPYKSSSRPRGRNYVSESGMKLREYRTSDGREHLGSALAQRRFKPFPGPPAGQEDNAPPLRVLPIGGLGEIGMNCMLAGVRDRYVVVDAGLMFPDFSDLGMQKILPDTDFLAQWKDRIEALIITHGHEDHIGALPWVVPALDPSTPIYATGFVMELIKKRLSEYNLWDERRFVKMEMRQRFRAGPFEIEPVRVTHSIPDCCSLVMRSEEGTLVHTGDWKIDEHPLDGQHFDRELFESLGQEGVALLMSDSTNVLAPGRTASEQVVHDSLIDKVLQHSGKGRVILTQFASNLHRLYGVKKAADAAGRKICFVGASLNHYLEAAWRDGRHPFEPRELLLPEHLPHTDPNEVLVVTTGSQGEPRAQLAMAAKEASKVLKIMPNDLLLYSAKVIPGNEGKVTEMLNALAAQGARIRQSRADNLHTSGHAYQEELLELLRSVRPQHFLPVHGEYAFLTEHAALAKERAGVNFVEVIRNGQMLAVRQRRNRNTLSTGSMAEALLRRDDAAAAAEAGAEAGATSSSAAAGTFAGAAESAAARVRFSGVIGGTLEDESDGCMVKFEGNEPDYYFNDGGKGTGTRAEMEIDMRTQMAVEGLVVVAVAAKRGGVGPYGMGCDVNVTTRGLWTDNGKLLGELSQAITNAVARLDGSAALVEVERTAIDAVKRRCFGFNARRPEVIATVYEFDPRDAHLAAVAEARAADARAANEARRASAAAAESSNSSSSSPSPAGPHVLTPQHRTWAHRPVGDAGAAAAAGGGGGVATLVPGAARRARPAPTTPAWAPQPSAAPAPPAPSAPVTVAAPAPAAAVPLELRSDSSDGDSASDGAAESKPSRVLRVRRAAAPAASVAAAATADASAAAADVAPVVLRTRRKRTTAAAVEE